MTLMYRSLRGCAAASLVALLAAACSGTDRTGAGRAGGEVEIAATWSGDEQLRFEKVLAAFTDETGTKVTFTSTGDDIATKLRAAIEGGAPPELAVLPQPGLMRDLVEQKALVEIESTVGAKLDESYATDWRTLGSVDGRLYGLFFKGANKSVVWYSTKAFDEAGVQPPRTWTDFMSAAKKLKDSGIAPLAIGGADAWTLTDWFENIYLRSAGPQKYDQLARHEIPWTDDSVKTALRIFGDVLKDRSMLHGDPAQVKFVDSVDAVFKSSPEAAMVYEGDFVPGVTTQKDAKPGETFDAFEFPSINGSDDMVVGGGDIVVMLRDSPQARSLLEFLASPEAGAIWAKEGGFSSPNKDVDPSSYPDDITRRVATSLADAKTFRFDMSDLAPSAFGGTPGRGQWLILQDFAKNPADIEGTARRLEEAAAAAYK